MKAPKLYPLAYTLRADKSAGNYRHFEVAVMDSKVYATERGELRPLLKITWQANGDEPSRFYGRTVELQISSSDGHDIAARLKLAARVIASLDATYAEDPRATLEALNLPRVAYDLRISRYTTQGDMHPTNERRFMDDYNIHGDDRGCTVAVMAPDAEQAARKLSQAWSAELAKYPGTERAERFARWTLAGCPVIQSSERYYGTPATFPPLSDLLNEPTPEATEPAA